MEGSQLRVEGFGRRLPSHPRRGERGGQVDLDPACVAFVRHRSRGGPMLTQWAGLAALPFEAGQSQLSGPKQ